ncbi:MAG: pentapeptide repeat-containing protein, partial [Proteobacteria bacterium]|nr:pentapeptide repeat-containing protein [Pseudomonadota bacterium]
MRDAEFGGSDLANADLRGADLRGTTFVGAYLVGTQFDNEAVMDQPSEGVVSDNV